MSAYRVSGGMALLLGTSLRLAAQEDEQAMYERFQKLLAQPVLSTTKTSHTLAEAPGVVTIITAEEIRESGARTLADILKRIPGVQIGDNRANVQMAWFRGVTTTYNEKVLLLIDGVPKRDATLSEWAPDERFDLLNVERIEVIRGPGSAVYGGDAFAAVVNLYTRQDADSAEAAGGGGNQGTALAGFRMGRGASGLDLVVSARAFKTDGYLSERGLNGNPTDNTNARAARNLQATATFRRNTKLNLILGDFDYRYPMHIVGSRRDANYRYTLGSLSHDHAWGGGEFHHQLNFDNTKIYFYEAVHNDANALRQIKEQTKQGTVFGLDSQGQWSLGASHNLVAGLSAEHKKATYMEEEWNPLQAPTAPTFHYYNSWFSQHGEGPGGNVARGTNYALHAQDEVRLPAWNSRMTLGLRWDHYQGFGGQFSPRLGWVAEPRAGTTLKALWGQAFRPPTFRQLYVVRFDGFQPGDPNLKPERARTWEAQVSQTVGKRTTLSLSYFRTTLTDITLTIANSRWYNSAIPRRISGLEVEGRAEFEPGLDWIQSLSLFANAGYLLKAYDDTPLGQVDIASVAPKTANAGLTLRRKGFSAFTALNYVGRRNPGLSYNPSKGLIENTYHAGVVVPEFKARDNKGAYLIQDLNLVFSGFSKLPLRIEASVFNLWDRLHYNPAHDPDTHYDIVKERRAFQVKFAVNF